MAVRSDLSYTEADHDPLDIYPDRTNFAYVDKWASLWPEKEAYVFRPSETERNYIIYGDLKIASENLGVWLKREYNVTKGDKVGILSLNRIEYALCDLALSRLGAVSVRLYVTMDSKSELTRNLKSTECRLFLCQFVSMKSARAVIPGLASHDPSQRLVSSELPKLEHVICMTGEASPGTRPLPDWRNVDVSQMEREELYTIQSTLTLDDDCSVYMTSGSTGVPKFVVQSYAGVLACPPGAVRRSGMDANGRYFTDRPMAHIGGNTHSVLTLGATMVIANPWKTLADNPCHYLFTIMKEERVNCGLSFPYILYDIVKSGETAEVIKALNAKFFIVGGQLTNQEILRAVKEGLGIPLVNAYGSTEMGEVAATKPDDTLDIMSRYVGHVLPGTKVKIVDSTTREILPRGVIGTIAIKRRHRWYYLNNEAKMRETYDEEGFFYQGDLARMTENGLIEIVGRDDDVITYGTVKVYPSHIETLLCTHPAVDKAIVFGVPDPRMYEVIGAVILPKPDDAHVTSDEIIQFFHEFVDENDLMTGLVYGPKFVWIEKSFPLTSSGKVNKKELRAQCLEKISSKE